VRRRIVLTNRLCRNASFADEIICLEEIASLLFIPLAMTKLTFFGALVKNEKMKPQGYI